MTDLLQDKANAEAQDIYDDVAVWLRDHGVNELDAFKISGMLTSFSIEYAKISQNIPIGNGVKWLTEAGPGVVDLAANWVEEGSFAKSLTMTLASMLVSETATFALAAALGGTLAVSGLGIVAGVAAGMAVDYLVDVGWDHFLGPHVDTERLSDVENGYRFRVKGSLGEIRGHDTIYLLTEHPIKIF